MFLSNLEEVNLSTTSQVLTFNVKVKVLVFCKLLWYFIFEQFIGTGRTGPQFGP